MRGELIVCDKFSVKQMKNFGTKNAETICLEIIIVKKEVLYLLCLPTTRYK